MKKFLLLMIMTIVLFTSFVYADATDGEEDIDIPSLTIEQLMVLSKSKQAKVDIIKKNNTEIERYKDMLSTSINDAAEKINGLRIDVVENSAIITDEKMEELQNLLKFLQESTTTLNEDATNVSKEIDAILDLIITKGMKLEQYDQIIENQNTLIVKMKDILGNIKV